MNVSAAVYFPFAPVAVIYKETEKTKHLGLLGYIILISRNPWVNVFSCGLLSQSWHFRMNL